MMAVILAGGKGTRLKNLTQEIPKPMVEVYEKPILLHQIEVLKRYGIKEIIIVVNYLGEKIKKYFDKGVKFGVNIRYIEEKEPLGTAGSLYFLKKIIKEDFLLIYGDVLFDISIPRFIEYHKEKKSDATLYVHPNAHPYDSDLILLNSNNKIIGIDSKRNTSRTYYSNCVNSGIFLFSKRIFDYVSLVKKMDLEQDIIYKMIKESKDIYGYQACEYVKDMGTLNRLEQVVQDYKNGIIVSKNLDKKQKCIFLDRDGTINKFVGLLSNCDQFQLEDEVATAIKQINQSNYLCIVITNQPVIARNLCTIEELNYIHKKMETLLGEKQAYLDEILYCPHHPDKGYQGENKKYKIKCNCRKPGTGLIDACIKKYNIDTKESYFIGDTTIDIKTGKNAKLKTILLKTGIGGSDKKYEDQPDYICNNLLEAIKIIMKGEH